MEQQTLRQEKNKCEDETDQTQEKTMRKKNSKNTQNGRLRETYLIDVQITTNLRIT